MELFQTRKVQEMAQSHAKNVGKHTTALPLASVKVQPEKRRYVLDVMDDSGNPSPSVINLDEYLQKKYTRKYEISRVEWYMRKAINVSIRHIDALAVPLILLLKILSCGNIQAAASLITRLVNNLLLYLTKLKT